MFQCNVYPPMQAFEDKAVCSRMSQSWHVGDASTLYNPGVNMTSYSVQYILPLTHAHSTQEPLNQVSKFFWKCPLTSKHTGSDNRLHATKLFEVQVQFVFGSSNQTSPGSLVFLWLSVQETIIGGGRTADEHCTCIGPVQEHVEKILSFHISPIWRVFPCESMQFGTKIEKDNKHESTRKSDINLRREKAKGRVIRSDKVLTLETLASLSLLGGNLTPVKLGLSDTKL